MRISVSFRGLSLWQDSSTLEFRNALGTFAAAVKIVTTHDSGGWDMGLTTNDFDCASLESPMALWNLGDSALSLGVFVEAKRFAVHLPAGDQGALALKIPARGADKCRGLDRSPERIPLCGTA